MEKIRKTIAQITGLDTKLMEQAQQRLDSLTKPQASLGRLEELAKLIVGITGREKPELKHKVIFTLAADHGVTEERVSAYPKEVTAQMVDNFLSGGAGINVLARHVGAKVVVVDMGVASQIANRTVPAGRQESQIANFKDKKINFGTKNFTKGPAMTRQEAIKSIEAGMDVFAEEAQNGVDIVGIGEMGIGNTTAASAITAVFTKQRIEDITGRGAGLDDEGLRHKVGVIKKALAINKPDPQDVIDVLSKVGGFEIAGLAGIILAASAKKVPVVIDGFISGSAALIAYRIEPKVKDYLIAGHRSVESGHKYILEHLGLKPLFDLDLRLGEGTGAALAIGLADAAVKILTQMATFQSANVSEKKK